MREEDNTTNQVGGSERRTDPGASGPSRRGVLAASAGLGAGALAGVPAASADRSQEDDSGDGEEVDEPEGFAVEPLAEPAGFSDEVAAMFSATHGDTTIDSNLPCDASNAVVAEATFEPEGTSGWHAHPGVGLVIVAEGEIEIVDGDECDSRTYAAGEAFLDPADHAHVATNTSDSDSATVYVMFLGVPDGAPATEWVESRDC